MKKYLVLFCYVFLCVGTAYGVGVNGALNPSQGLPASDIIVGPARHNEDVLIVEENKYGCNKVFWDNDYVGGTVLTVVSARLDAIKQYECQIKISNDKWVEDTDIFCPSSPLQNMNTANSYVALLHNNEYVTDRYSVISGKPNVGKTLVYNGNACVWAACDDNYEKQGDKCVPAETKPKDCDTTPHGALGDVDCAGATPPLDNAAKCTAMCNNGEWEGYQISDCVKGYFLKDKDKKCRRYGSACDEKDMPQFATAGQYIKGRDGAKCAATKCQLGAYLVVKKGKKDESLGWCVYGTHCDGKPGTKLNIIDETKTDLQCVKIESETSGNGAPAKEPEAGNNTNNSPAKNNNANNGVNDPNQNTPQGNGGGGDNSVTPVPNVETPGDENPQPTNNVPVDGGTCVSADKNATAGIYEDGVCVPALCRDGFEIVKYVCVEIGGDCDEMPENASAAHRAWDAQGGRVVCVIDDCEKNYNLSDDKMTCEQDKKAVAQDALDKAKDKEQSTENKLLGGATMAATGIGGMQAMSAMAEQSADADAEEAMRAYLATFHCNYGGGINIPGGEKDVQLPGGNELVGLYSEYVNLANDLKVRKNALGMKPGIESESILDSATSGLYDDVAIGKTSGAFTSLARALQNPDGPDAAAWAAQKSDTANKLKTGATMAGIGAVGGAVGNLLINRKDDKKVDSGDKSDKSKQDKVSDKKLADTIKAKVKDVKVDVGTDKDAVAAVVSTSDAGAQVVTVATVPGKPDETVQLEVSDITQQVTMESGASGEELLNNLSKSLNREPSNEFKVAWQEYADKCKKYSGVLSLEQLSSFDEGYGLMCEFVDLEQTDDIIKDFYKTKKGSEYFTTDSIDRELQIEKTDDYKKSRYGKNDTEAWKRWADMNSTWLVERNGVDVGDGKYIYADGKYRALIYIKRDMTLLMNKHNNGKITEYEVK